MEKVEELIERAISLRESGLSVGQIADELNISKETATWLLTRPKGIEISPKDISVDWSAIGKGAQRLTMMASMLSDLLLDKVEDDIDTVVGISLSGVPLGVLVAENLDTNFAVYIPKKQFEKSGETGTFSRNFGDIEGRRCVIIDDVITSGGTITEVCNILISSKAKPLAIGVMVDKEGINEVYGVPVLSLIKVTPI
ncbi:MAG: orotate phosphoribosyltransferase-like protein [Methermicoccaceae archaeon]